MENLDGLPPSNEESLRRAFGRKTRRDFLIAGAAGAAGLAGLDWLSRQPDEEGVPLPLRRMLEGNETLARRIFSHHNLAREFRLSEAREPRPNGNIGLSEEPDTAGWRLTLEGATGSEQPLRLSLDDIRGLPPVQQVTELHCIEGWSEIVCWRGARFRDFFDRYPPISASTGGKARFTANDFRYVAMETPDEEYYVGLDLESALHPQTLLCYEMNGSPLSNQHGAPLRLVLPVKYGIKNLKRIGTIRYSNSRPRDYWAERGYDWYAGL